MPAAGAEEGSMKNRATWINNTNCDVRMFDHVIAAACNRGDGVLPEEIADVFVLVRTPPGSAADWRLDLKPDDVAGR